MKKILLTTLSSMALLGLVGCGTQDIKNNDLSNQMLSSNEGEGLAQSIDGLGLTDEEFKTMKQIYGEITSVIGNEIEVIIANDPFLTSEEEGDEEVSEGGAVITPVIESDLPMLEYTGEKKSYIIPTGTVIFSLNGQGSINDLKEGSVVSISIFGDEGAEKIYSIDILE